MAGVHFWTGVCDARVLQYMAFQVIRVLLELGLKTPIPDFEGPRLGAEAWLVYNYERDV